MQTCFDTGAGTQQGPNGINSFSHVTTTEFDRRTSHSKDGQIALQVTGAGVTQTSTSRLVAHPSRMNMSLNSAVDPFFKLPGGLGEQGFEAVDHCKGHTGASLFAPDKRQSTDNKQVYRGSFHPLLAMRNCGLVTRVRETAAFFQLLAFSSWHMSILREESQSFPSLQFAARANRELQKQICDPITSKSMELLMGVLIFASSSVNSSSSKLTSDHPLTSLL